jgi:glycerophosphoryl diester phosphodiesterase
LQCAAIIFNFSLWSVERVQAAHAAGFKCLSYTVNDESVAQWLIAIGTDGIITDRVDLFSPAAR